MAILPHDSAIAIPRSFDSVSRLFSLLLKEETLVMRSAVMTSSERITTDTIAMYPESFIVQDIG
jgi:hypothetical protein